MKGIKRFRQAIRNQRDAGEVEFHLTHAEAEELAAEIEKEFGWAEGVPAPVDADGEVVPLTTEVMYRDGDRPTVVACNSFSYHSGDNHWGVNFGLHGVGLVSDFHLTLPDSWERLDEDIVRCKDQQTACAYYGRGVDECIGCSSIGGPWCVGSMASDVLRRAKALAERDARGVEQ